MSFFFSFFSPIFCTPDSSVKPKIPHKKRIDAKRRHRVQRSTGLFIPHTNKRNDSAYHHHYKSTTANYHLPLTTMIVSLYPHTSNVPYFNPQILFLILLTRFKYEPMKPRTESSKLQSFRLSGLSFLASNKSHHPLVELPSRYDQPDVYPKERVGPLLLCHQGSG